MDVMLDSDIAELYGVETREVNQAVTRNPDKFPADFMFELTDNEYANLKSQIVTSSWGGRRKPPKVFTEQGVYLLATVLKGSKAIETTIAIMRTFTKMRRYLLEHGDLARQIAELRQEITANKQWTKDRLSATADAITILEEMILEVKSAKEVENIGFLRDKQ